MKKDFWCPWRIGCFFNMCSYSVVKQRMQTGQFASASDVVRLIVSREVFKGLYAGYGSFLLHALPFDDVQFYIYEQIRIGYKLAAKRDLSDPENAIIGAFAGAMTGAVTTPLDIIKTRLMVQLHTHFKGNNSMDEIIPVNENTSRRGKNKNNSNATNRGGSSGQSSSMSQNSKRSRGPTCLQVMATGANDKKLVEWNERGQPVGDVSVKFSSTMGLLVREQVSIVYESWLKVEDSTKETLWRHLLQKYHIDKCFKIFILQQMGKLWRSWKSELSTEIQNILESRSTNAERTSQLAKLRPFIVPAEDWDQFVQERMSTKWQEKSDKMRGIRSKQLLSQTLSRKGYARAEYEYNKEHPDMPMTKAQLWIKGHTSKKKTSEANASKIDEVKKKMEEATSKDEEDNILTQVLGRDHPGRIRGMGAGVTRTKLYGHTQAHAKYVEMEAELKDMKQKYKIIEDVLASKFGVNLADHVPGKGATSKSNDHCEENDILEATSPKSGKGSSYHPSIHDKCKLVNWNGDGQVVAKGKISAIDPKANVYGSILGPECYRIAIEEVLVDSVGFYRYEPEFTTLGDALGSTIAWPIRYIVFDD